MRKLQFALLIVGGLTAVALPAAASARPHHHNRGHSSVRIGVVSPYVYGNGAPYAGSSYGYPSPYTDYGYATYGGYGYAPYRNSGHYRVSHHQRDNVSQAIYHRRDAHYRRHHE